MTDNITQQQKLWLILQGAGRYAHVSAAELSGIVHSGKRQWNSNFHRAADRHLVTVMSVFSKEEMCRIVKTWLSSYQLPFDPCRLNTFDQFHITVGGYIVENDFKFHPY